MSNEPAVVFDDDNPEWTADDFVRAARDADVPPHIQAAFGKRGAGRPRGSDKEQVTLRLDRAALDRFRAAGPGWQTRINDALRKAAGL